MKIKSSAKVAEFGYTNEGVKYAELQFSNGARVRLSLRDEKLHLGQTVRVTFKGK